MKRTRELFVLRRGTHASADAGACLLEAVSYVAGEPWSDHPECVCQVLAAYGRAVNDRMGDEDRQLLVPLIPRLIGTRGSLDLALRRMYLLVDRSVRQIVPRVLRDLASARAAEPLPRARAASYNYATAHVTTSAAAADAAAYAATSCDTAAKAATYAADAASVASVASYSSEHAALVVAAFVEAIDLQEAARPL